MPDGSLDMPVAPPLHAANHPDTRHLITSIYAVDPTDVVKPGQRVGLAWLSPDCKPDCLASARIWGCMPWTLPQRLRPKRTTASQRG